MRHQCHVHSSTGKMLACLRLDSHSRRLHDCALIDLINEPINSLLQRLLVS